MNVERTIRFIPEQQAQTSALAAQIAAMAARQERRTGKWRPVLKLLKAGMKMLAAHDRRFDVVEGKLDQILNQTVGKRTNGNRRRS